MLGVAALHYNNTLVEDYIGGILCTVASCSSATRRVLVIITTTFVPQIQRTLRRS